MAITEIEKLQELLVGATILKITKSTQVEGLFDLVFNKNGSKYEATLHATDLGWWMDRVSVKKEDVTFAEDLNFFTLVFDHVTDLIGKDPSLSENPLQPVWNSEKDCGFNSKVTGRKWRYTGTGSSVFDLDLFTSSKESLKIFSELLYLHCHGADMSHYSYDDDYLHVWHQIYCSS